ncbi:MAG: MFS transporter [Vicinamibacteria bacterium]|nr:MFS transporter [Vicinamibacteria bacterium]
MSRPQTHVAATAFLSLFSIVGFALYGLPFFYDFFVRDLGWTRQQVTSGNAYSKLLIGPLFGFLAGWFIDRFGPRRLMLAGIVMAGGALVGLGTVSTLAFFYLFYVFNALGYVCGGPLPNQVLLSRWFDTNRGKAMGFAYLGIGVGGAIVPLLAHALTQRLGWQAALQILGVLMVVIAFPMAWFVREKPEDVAARGANQQPLTDNLHPATAQSSIVNRQSSISAGALPSLASALKSPAFYLLMVGSMCSIGAVGGTMQNLKLYLSLDVKLAQGEVAQIASLVLVGSLIGRIAMGYLADRFAKKYVMLLIYSIVACTIPLLFLADLPAARYAFALLFGIGLGGDYMIIPLMAAELFGVKMLGRLMGIVLTADGIAEATAPMLVAGIRDATGSYAGGFSVLIGLAAVGAVAVALLPKRLPA